ncbi:MAG: hypothetical protein JO362_19460 [Streptomycetaceae bacterium]|nr:hypothetical protein [Streptomycetaceae bacterium]
MRGFDPTTMGSHALATVEQEYADVTPGRYVIPEELLEDLRSALVQWWDHSDAKRPRAVSFRITEYEDGRAWATDGPTLYFAGSPQGVESRIDFKRTLVADALVEISEFDAPQYGDTLRIVLPAA